MEPCTQQGIENPTIKIDNAPAHSRLETICEEFSHVRILRSAPYSCLLNPIELMWRAFKSNVKRMLQESMPDIWPMNQATGLSVYEQRMRELEAVAGNAIALLTPNMLTLFANKVQKYYPRL